jgi:hypothetical protein
LSWFKNLLFVAGIVAAPLVTGMVPSGGAGALTAPPTVSAQSWTLQSVQATTGMNGLHSISCTSSTFCVAVGGFEPDNGILIEQWNGTSWSQVSDPVSVQAGLTSVSCVGPSFCVAVGMQFGTTGALALVWNGSTWSEAMSGISNPSNATAVGLGAVSCVSDTSCETLGSYFAQPGNVTTVFAYQWNGSSWQAESTPTPTATGTLPETNIEGIDCVSSTWCIAVGVASGNANSITVGTPISEIWNGSAWSSQATPAPSSGTGSTLSSVSCAGAGFCQAVGENFFTSASNDQNLIESWNGSTWAIDSGAPNISPNGLSGVDCYSATTCTAVGTQNAATASAASLVLDWNGTTWSTVANTPSVSSAATDVSGVSCVTDWACVAVGGSTPTSGSTSPFAMSAPIARSGYRFVASDGGIFAYGSGAPFLGSMGGQHLNAPIVGMAVMPGGDGYYLVASDGGIFSYGGAQFYGSMGGKPLNKPIVGMAVTADGAGYWEVASDGGIFSFGDAQFYGSMGGSPLNKPVVGIAATPDGRGYYEVASDGGVFNFGDATFDGSAGSLALNKPVVGISVPVSGGYYLVASDGGIFSYPSTLAFYGSTGSIRLNAPVVGMATTSGGYYFVASDGGIFSYPTMNGPAFLGSRGGQPLDAPIVGIAA